jgi:hypothetical protein
MNTILIWAGDKVRDDFMHAADIFGQYKMLIDSFEPIVYKTKDIGLEQRSSQMAALLQTVREKVVIAAFYVVDLPECSWCDRSIWQVSDGQRHTLLIDLLKHYGWENPPLPHKISSPEFNAARSEAMKLLKPQPVHA